MVQSACYGEHQNQGELEGEGNWLQRKIEVSDSSLSEQNTEHAFHNLISK